ncbi:MAG: hypothetical protein KDL87_02395, partial [Verrucomicrobiae bacterium]|nr:hypothetical protein [Verrucomicrobiae bacterium]
MPSFLSTPRFVFTWVIAAGLLLSSCDAPVKTPNPPEPEQKPTEAAQASAAPSPPSAVPEAPASAPTPEAPQPEIPTDPTLEIREEGNKIVVKGWLSSRYQAQDIINGLTSSFPDAEVINELQTDPGVTEVGWGNRVLELVVPLLGGTTDARFF